MTSADRELALSNIQKAWTQINEGFEQGLNTPINNPEEKQLDAQFRQNWDAWKRAHESYLDRERQFYQLGISNPEQKRLELLLQGQDNSPEMERVNQAIAARSKMLEANRQKQALFTEATTSLLALLQNNQEFATQIQQGSIRTTQQVRVIAILVRTYASTLSVGCVSGA